MFSRAWTIPQSKTRPASSMTRADCRVSIPRPELCRSLAFTKTRQASMFRLGSRRSVSSRIRPTASSFLVTSLIRLSRRRVGSTARSGSRVTAIPSQGSTTRTGRPRGGALLNHRWRQSERLVFRLPGETAGAHSGSVRVRCQPLRCQGVTHVIGIKRYRCVQNGPQAEVVAGVGIEPTTRGFSIRCSTN